MSSWSYYTKDQKAPFRRIYRQCPAALAGQQLLFGGESVVLRAMIAVVQVHWVEPAVFERDAVMTESARVSYWLRLKAGPVVEQLPHETTSHMNLLFCDDPVNPRRVDADFEEEFSAAKVTGFQPLLFSYEGLTKDKSAVDAIQRIPPSDDPQRLIYRGWMVKPSDYQQLYAALLARNYRLINSPEQYQHGHYLPESYPAIARYTPKTVWTTLNEGPLDYEAIFELLVPFGNAPIIVKDFVKSQKHYWKEACYIPEAQDKDQVKAVVDKFLALQGSDLNQGLVFREFVSLADLTMHSKSGMPLKLEYRLFFLHHQLVGCYTYWEEGEYALDEQPPLDHFTQIAQRVKSNFFSMDIAKTSQGDWIIIELGDGQVAGLPERANKEEFYRLLKRLG